MNPVIAAAVCTRHRAHLLRDAVASIERQSVPREAYHIMIVDNSTGESEARSVRRAIEPASVDRYLREPLPGISRARNAALSGCEAPLLAYLDDDARAAPDWLERIIHTFRAAPASVACTGGPVRGLWPQPRPGWLGDPLLGYLSIVDWGKVEQPLTGSQWLACTNMALRVDAVRRVGGFHHGLGRTGESLLSNEDLDLCERLRAGGSVLWYSPQQVVHHLIHPERLDRRWFRRRAFWQGVSDAVALSRRESPLLAGLVQDLPTGPSLAAEWRQAFVETDDPRSFERQCERVRLAGVLLRRHHPACFEKGADPWEELERRDAEVEAHVTRLLSKPSRG